MRASPSSSSNPRDNTSLINRFKTIFKKAYELSILCEIEVCVIHYGPDGKLQTWPEERQKVKDMALRYVMATKRKKSLNLHEFLEKEKDEKQKKKKKTKRDLGNVKGIKYPDWYPIFDHYSLNQLSQLIMSLELTLATLQERLRFVEAQKQRNTNLGLTPSSLNHHHQYQNQPLNPNQFSLFMYNHGDATLSQLPLSASHSNYQNHLMQQDLYGFDHNLNNSNFLQPPCLSVQESEVNNYDFKNHLMQQKELYGSHQNMCMTNYVINNNIQEHTCLSNTVPDEFCSDFKSPYGDMIGSNGFSKDFPDLFSSYDESSLTQTSSLPPLHTIPNNYLLSHNSRFP